MTVRSTFGALFPRHLTHRPGGGIVVALLAFLLAAIATAAPMAIASLNDAITRDGLQDVAPTVRDVSAHALGSPIDERTSWPQTAETAWAPLLTGLEKIRTSADEPLSSQLQPAQALTVASKVPFAQTQTELANLAFSPSYSEHITIVDGALPAPPDASAPFSQPLQVVMSVKTAADLGWNVGEQREVPNFSHDSALVLVGTFEPTDPADPYWEHATSILTPDVYDDGNSPKLTTGTGFADPAAVVLAENFSGSISTDVWFGFTGGDILSKDVPAVRAGLAKLTSKTVTIDKTAFPAIRFTAGLIEELDVVTAQQQATLAVIVLLVTAPAGVAAAVLTLACRTVVEARRSSLRLLAARGASSRQLRGLAGIEGIVAGFIPALVGGIVAIFIASATFNVAPSVAALVPAVIVGLIPPLFLWFVAPGVANAQERSDLGGAAPRWRVLAEGFVLAITVIAVVLLFSRGYSSSVDLLLAAAPLLLAIVACLITLRLYPLPLRAVFSRARRGSGLNAFVGSARSIREPAIGLTPVLALVVGVAVAVSSAVLLSVVQLGATQSAQAQIGADVRVTGATFFAPAIEEVRAIDGVDEVAAVSGAQPITLFMDTRTELTNVFFVDGKALAEVQGDAAGLLPAGVDLTKPIDGKAPMVVSPKIDERLDTDANLSVKSAQLALAGVLEGPSPIGTRADWILVDASHSEDMTGGNPDARTLLIKLTAGADREATISQLRSLLGDSVRIDTSRDIATKIDSSPAVQGVRAALLAATISAAILGAIAIVLTLTLASNARTRVIALLRTLGASRRSETSLALWEVGPPAVAALIGGTVFGALIPLVVMRAVDLRAFTGSTAAPAYAMDPQILLLTLGAFVGVSAIFTALALFVSRRVRAAGALRTVEEG